MRNKPIEKICVICGSTYSIHVCHASRSLVCSRKCHGILLRRRRQEQIEKTFGKSIHDLLYDLYYNQEMGIKQIAKEIGVSDRVVWDWFDDANIPRRERSDAVSLQWKDNQERRTQTAQIMGDISKNYYRNGGINPAKRPDVAAKISKANKGESNGMFGKFGSDNPNWKGGKITYRGAGWISIRTQVKRRDGNKCRRCGTTENLQVHHIIPYRETKNNSLDNLVTLCNSCHMAVEHSGATWN